MLFFSFQIVETLDELKITHSSEEFIKVICSPKVSDLRPYIVCCKVSDVNFNEDSNLLKKFITLQVCKFKVV